MRIKSETTLYRPGSRSRVTRLHLRLACAAFADSCVFISMPLDPPMACQMLERRYLDNMTSERVDAGGVSNIAELLRSLPPANSQV